MARETGYISRLQEHFTVIAMDLRGHGESALLPEDPDDYTIDKLCQDILAVADACGVECFCLWGMSYGGKVGRYLAVQSERVGSCILIGTPLGPGVSGQPHQDAQDFCAHWSPIVQARRAGTNGQFQGVRGIAKIIKNASAHCRRTGPRANFR